MTKQYFETCESCGGELRGEICEVCFSAADQTFDSFKPSENFLRYFACLVLVCLFGFMNYIQIENNSKNTFTEHILFIGCLSYITYLVFIYLLATIGIIEEKTLNKIDINKKLKIILKQNKQKKSA